MSKSTTQQALADFTDEGLFERMAMAILREVEPRYRTLIHPGVNAGGKTVKSPVDGIGFVPNSNPLHLVAVHHTITASDGLENKWLHNPARVKTRGGGKPTAPAGDLIKTAEIIAQERIANPNLLATLVLTTNQEPSAALLRLVVAEGRACGIEIDVWSRSRLSDYLDNTPNGQWIRKSFLGVEQEQLSFSLFQEISKKNLIAQCPLDDPAAWVPRELDTQLKLGLRRDVTFLVAGSGLGKTVACYRMLKAHVEEGGIGLVLPHDAVASSNTLEQAIIETLSRDHPSLAVGGPSPLSFSSSDRPLLLVVEDVNRSGQTLQLVEKLARWSINGASEGDRAPSSWRLICPVWPEALSSIGDQARKIIDARTISVGCFSPMEGSCAVQGRARVNGRELSALNAEEIATALGHDPLLIALHDLDSTPEPTQTIRRFIERSLSRAAASEVDHSAADFRLALRTLAAEMLKQRQFELHWINICRWDGLRGESLRLLSRLAHQGELLKFIGPSDDQVLSFRHDRIRYWILVDAAVELNNVGQLSDEIVGEPYFAEIVGATIAWANPDPSLISRIAALNPLGLFQAIHLIGHDDGPTRDKVLFEINAWLEESSTHDSANLHLRHEALAKLAETSSSIIPSLVLKFREDSTNAQLARLRNGDLSGAIALCCHLSPGMGAPWRDLQLEHAKRMYSVAWRNSLDAYLRRTDLNITSRVGALRLAGHLADAGLAVAIEACWGNDPNRLEILSTYLWAFGQCCQDDPARFLGPVCDAWASLPDESSKDGKSSPRNSIAAHDLRWAFQKWPPKSAINYLINRGNESDLKWPITYLLHGVDDSRSIIFVVTELASMRKEAEESGHFYIFGRHVNDEWERAQDNGHPMSKGTRDVLLRKWINDKEDKYIRATAFSIWAATKSSGDIEILRDFGLSSGLEDAVIWARLVRNDDLIITELVDKFNANEGYWWQCCRYIWSQELTNALDLCLDQRRVIVKNEWFEHVGSDWITREAIMRLPRTDAERLLLKHWDHLRYSSDFVQAGLYVATDAIMKVVNITFNECPDPTKLLEHYILHIGIRTKGHPGITSESQVRAIGLYLKFLPQMDINELWEVCGYHGWHSLQKELLEPLLVAPYPRNYWILEHVENKLDDIVDNGRLFTVDGLIDGYLKSGVKWEVILRMLEDWSRNRSTLGALQVHAAAVLHCGSRSDLSSLIFDKKLPEIAAEIIEDTTFALKRRRIS